MRIVWLFLLLLSLAAPLPSLAGEPFEMLESPALKGMIDKKTPGLMVIDARSEGEFKAGHIGAAINIPLAQLEQDATLPKAAKDAPLVFYCSGST